MMKLRLIISLESRLRQGWEEAFLTADPPVNDKLLLKTAEPSEFDLKEWQW